MGGDRWPEDPAGLFGWNLRLLREGKGLSQPELARLMQEAGHRWHQSTVYRVESGKQELKAAELADLARILRTSMERFTWTGPEANATGYVYAAGARLAKSYEETAAAVRRYLHDRDAAVRVAGQYRDSEYERVREACADVAGRIEGYDGFDPVDEGEKRHRGDTGQEEGEGDDGQADEAGQPGVVDQQRA